MTFYHDIVQRILEKKNAELNLGQEQAVDQFLRFHHEVRAMGVFMLKGAAGTGKTFVIDLLKEFLSSQGFKVALLAPTGRAAKVLNRRSKSYSSTIHRYIYTPVDVGGGLSFQLKENKDPMKMYYIVDEASMVGENKEGRRSLLDDLIYYIYTEEPRHRLIVVGDHAQLPPVGSKTSPALDAGYLRSEHGLNVVESDLNQVMRQAFDSEILEVADAIRKGMEAGKAPELEISYSPEVELLENTWSAIEYYTGFYNPDDLDYSVMICYSNRVATELNQAIRHQLLEAEEPLMAGDRIMVVKNNYAWGDRQFPFIANGEMGIVREVYHESKENKYGLSWIDVEIEFQGIKEEPAFVTCKVMLDLLNDKKPQMDYGTMQRIFLERQVEFEEMTKVERKKKMRKDPYLQALQIKYGYCITGHKSQGGQWKYVIVSFEPMYKGMNLKEYMRWAYTAVTRAEEKLFLDKFPFLVKDD